MSVKETILHQHGEVVLTQVDTVQSEGSRPVVHYRLTQPDKPSRVTIDHDLALSAFRAATSLGD